MLHIRWKNREAEVQAFCRTDEESRASCTEDLEQSRIPLVWVGATPLKSCCQATLQARSVVCSVQKAWCLAGHGQHLRALYVRRGVRSASCFVITFQDVALLRGLWVRKG